MWEWLYPGQCCKTGYCIEGEGVSLHNMRVSHSHVVAIVNAHNQGHRQAD